MPEEPRSEDRPESRPDRLAGDKPNMHENVEAWEDTCSCEPEPHWQQVEDEEEGPEP